MDEAVRAMLSRYRVVSADDAVNAVREAVQQVALLGLWRARLFEHAAFYGGSALRILHGLDRFSEDLDFTLLAPQPDLTLSRFVESMAEEVRGFGFDVAVSEREKASDSRIRSAFLKANTRQLLMDFEAGRALAGIVPANQALRVKLEVDTDPPSGFDTEVRYVLQPIPFAVRVCALPDLLAGKVHAVLFRPWKTRVKGRDWFDLVWYAANHPDLRLSHLEQRMRQTGDWSGPQELTWPDLQRLSEGAVNRLDVNRARDEVRPFVRRPEALDVWSQAFFHDVIGRLRPTEGG
ncbi:MAG: nucleotidyl transferase AbiEii/AbiGii toxin family protein [Armatimonadetes bacterium]|nr:nucleotidyl transferase AbiEii/AbiGii toxin family protein [Armatimonadota bacterium]